MAATKLRTLLDRVEKGEWADREIDRDLHAATHAPPPRGCVFGRIPPYTASIDAAVALVEKVLPRWKYGFESDREIEGRFVGSVWKDGAMASSLEQSQTRTPARAILAALLRAKIVQEEKNG